MKYIKQLDVIRAIAVIMVIFSHWIPGANNILPFGSIGVDMFFVLSGFLISRILFAHRDKAEKLNTPISTLIKSFYVRRLLRIFPIYYLVVFILIIVADYTDTSIKTSYPYFLTYTSNFFFLKLVHGMECFHTFGLFL